MRSLRIAGWVGIVLFFLVAIAASIPSEDYILGGPDGPPLGAPRQVSDLYVLFRLAVSLALFVLLLWFYRLRPSASR